MIFTISWSCCLLHNLWAPHIYSAGGCWDRIQEFVLPLLSQERLERGGPRRLRQRGDLRKEYIHMKGVLPGLVRWARRIGTRDFCSVLGALVDLVKKSSSPDNFLLYLSPSPSKLGRQSCRVACLLLSVFGCHICKPFGYLSFR